MTLRKICYHYHKAWSVADFSCAVLKYLWKFFFKNWDVVQERKCLYSLSAGKRLLMGIKLNGGRGRQSASME